ncbi:response regulator [Paenibacillus sp. YN15]|uniref:response regulator n=1 Tax=Paenibacillus sp. YN15 TaxID=1742774 RepID=UPI000DCEF8EF|nr:response regulator [Paenibacillus sp. YN15]RAV04139.1 DNA-binding response regulator [Paenibacillus sp. YN15]
MYKLVIVDDEPSVVNGLSTYFDWNSYGIRLAGTADDGDKGLALIKEVEPDIVLTDVKMPSMDGIQMSTEIRGILPGAKIIFISGFDNAEYLKSALKVHAVDYIFKPVSRKELHTVITRVLTSLEEEARAKELVNEMQVKLVQSLPLLREKFLLSLIADSFKEERVKEKIQFLDLPLLGAQAYIVIVIVIDDLSLVMESRSERDKQLLSYAALNIIQELMDKTKRGVVFEKAMGEYAGILVQETGDLLEDGENGLLDLAAAVRDNLSRWLKISVTIGVGEYVDKLSELPLSYKQAREAAAQKWYLGKNQILTVDHLQSSENEHYRLAESEDQVLSAMKAGDTAGLLSALDEIFESMARSRKNGFRYGKNISQQLILLSSRVLLELNALTADWEAKEAEAWELVLRQETLQDLKKHVSGYLEEICSCVKEKRGGKTGSVIERIHRLIQERYAENLTVVDIAEGVYLSPTYVSLLYKQETGKTLFEYLTKVRIDKAKELLQDPRNKFYEVCHAVGYADPSHFSKLFKKMTGYTPSAYRDQL